LIFTAFFLLPIAGLVGESVKLYVPGSIGSAEGAPRTLENYRELARASFAGVVFQTLLIAALASVVGVLLSLPFAHWIVRRMAPSSRALVLCLLIALMFLSVLVRTYSLELSLGAAGPARALLTPLGVLPNSKGYIFILVGLGLLHYVIPMATLTLVGTIQNIDPRLVDAASVLGAPAWKAHFTVTVPLAARGLLAAFLFSFTFSVSAFVIPMILGKGRVVFVSNLIFSRFSEIANYPSGAAISIVVLVISLAIIFAISLLGAGRRRTGGHA
jgi:putative spermidine/putrescine transport system permease protein